MKALSTTWVPRSRRKLRNSRGENWVEESWSATTVRPRTRAMTVTTVLLTVMSSARASSAVPWNARRSSGEPGATVTWDIAEPTASAASPATPGSTHNAPLTYSLRVYQATDRRTRRTKPSELEVDFIDQATAGEPGRSSTAFGSFAYATAGRLPASSQCEIDDGQHPADPDACRHCAEQQPVSCVRCSSNGEGSRRARLTDHRG